MDIKKKSSRQNVFYGVASFLALLTTLILNQWTHFVSRTRLFYREYSILNFQTEAFFHGHLALSFSPHELGWDLIWNNGIHQPWGLGVPFFRFIFELPGHFYGLHILTDRITYLIAYWICAVFLIQGVVISLWNSRANISFAKLLQSMAILFLLLFSPPLLALLQTRFIVYEEIVAYAYLYAIGLIYALLRVAQKPKTSSLLIVSAISGLAPFVRPTLLFYGVSTFICVVLVARKAGKRPTVMLGMLSVFLSASALLGYLNWVRFGSALEFGTRLNLEDINVLTFIQKIGLPKESIFIGIKDVLGSLFFLPSLNGFDFYKQSFFLGQAAYPRWHEMYFSTYDVVYLLFIFYGIIAWLNSFGWRFFLKPKNVHQEYQEKVWDVNTFGQACSVYGVPWACMVLVAMVVFYAKFQCMSSRYAIDFLAAINIIIVSKILLISKVQPQEKKKDLYIILWSVVTLIWLALEIYFTRIDSFYKPSFEMLSSSPSLNHFNRAWKKRNGSMQVYEKNADESPNENINRIPFNGAGWNSQTGEVKQSVIFFATNPTRVSLVLTTTGEHRLTLQKLENIQIKVGLDFLARESIDISSDQQHATVVFKGPTRERYQSGLQVFFLGFVGVEDVWKKVPDFQLQKISFNQ